MDKELISTHNFISKRWKDGARVNNDPTYYLPYPFVPPCIDGYFQCLFYWDTFYTNKGLILDGYVDLAYDNVRDLFFMLDKYGYVPNSNSYPGVKHNSQPPYLNLMVNDIYEQKHNKEWLKESYFALKKEYEFWMTQRITPIGLNRYYHHSKTKQEYIDFYDYVATRLEIDKNASLEDKIRAAHSYNAACEGGLDFSPRYGQDGDNMCPIDLNCLMLMFESNMAKWSKEFEPEMTSFFENAKNKRAELINKYCLDIDGIYYDYDFKKCEIRQKEFGFTGQFFPYISGLSNNKEACKKVLSKVEFKYGIASTSKYPGNISYQAAYPYSWPYDNGIAFWGLISVGLKEDALRIGKKYLHLCANSYVNTGHLWETYSAISDEIAQKKEYENKEMMGWTAGIYQWIYNYVKNNE